MYRVIDKNNFPKRKQYDWFKTFANPCYGFNVKMDVTELVKLSKETKTIFLLIHSTLLRLASILSKKCESAKSMVKFEYMTRLIPPLR